MMELMDKMTIGREIEKRYETVYKQLEEAALRTNRDPKEITVLAVSKLQPVEKIRSAYDAGIRFFGESYVEEALPKMEALIDLENVIWEMVGHVQSRKAKLVANSFSRLHSLSSIKLARLLNRHRDTALSPMEVLIQVNVSGEESKQGVDATEREKWDNVLKFAQELKDYPNLKLTGLMSMPPLFDDPEQNRPYFQQVRELLNYLNEKDSSLNLHELSMGTSYDFVIAIEEGATIVRLGSSLLGERHK
jgi:hypothetical protein